MAGEGLQKQTIQVPFVRGLDTKTHPFAVEPPGLTTCKNVEFDEVGALRIRKPFVDFSTNIHPSGTLGAVRKIAVVDDELVAFTATALYAWSPALSKWISRGTHLAVKVSEATRFANINDQTFADRAEVDGCVVQVWTEVSMGGTSLSYLAAYDNDTGATLIAPTSFTATRSRPRVIALSATILVFWETTGTGIEVKSITPTNPSFSPSGAISVLGAAYVHAYDVIKDPNANQAVLVGRRTDGTAYTIATITSAGTVTTSVKARTADGVIALTVAPSGDRVQIVRTNGNNVLGDLLVLSTLADVNVSTAIGSGPSALQQLTCAYRSVTDGGFYRAYVFWSAGESTGSSGFACETNWIDTNNAVGTESTFLLKQGVASRAFDYGGQIYVWTVFAGESQAAGMGVPLGIRAQAQNTYFLHRDDGFLVSKATWGRAGGFGAVSGQLPGVAVISGATQFAWCGVERQLITTGGSDHSGYGARAPRDIIFTFDSNEARRVVQLGRTAYVSGGLLMQYDGEGLVEVGFSQYPWYFGTAAIAGGALSAGTYNYKSTLEWINAKGEVDRSTTATGQSQAAAANDQVVFTAANLHITAKQSAFSRRAAAFQLWRTLVNTSEPFYLITSKDPSTTGANSFVANDPTVGFATFGNDQMSDAVAATKEQSPENGGRLPGQAPPGANILCASENRLFLAGVPGEPNRVWYSQLRGETEVATFSSILSFEIPSSCGAITGLAIQDETLIVFTINTTLAYPGDGFANNGGGSNFGPARFLSRDIGCRVHDAIAHTPDGVIFPSKKGWYRLSHGWTLEYIGAPVEGFNDSMSTEFLRAHTVEGQHQVRVGIDDSMLVFDYLVGQWSQWTQGCVDMAIWQGTPMVVADDGVVAGEQEIGSSDLDYEMEIETGWIRLNGLMGFARVYWIQVLGGDDQVPHEERVRIGRDYKDAYFADRRMEFGLSTGNPVQFRHTLSQQRCEAIRVRINVHTTSGGTPTDEVVKLVGLALECGFYPGLYRRLPAAQKQ